MIRKKPVLVIFVAVIAFYQEATKSVDFSFVKASIYIQPAIGKGRLKDPIDRQLYTDNELWRRSEIGGSLTITRTRTTIATLMLPSSTLPSRSYATI